MDSSDEASLYALQWNFFDRNLKKTFANFESLAQYSDVTLLCQGQKLQAHRVVLHAGSDYFRDIFAKLPGNNMVIYMHRVGSRVLRKLLEFLYCGEVQVEKDDLKDFLVLAEDLKVKGITNKSDELKRSATSNSLQATKRKKLEENIKERSSEEKRLNEIRVKTEAFSESKHAKCVDESSCKEEEEENNPLEDEDESSKRLEDEEYCEDKSNVLSSSKALSKSFSRYRRIVAKVKKDGNVQHELTRGSRRRCGQCSVQKVEKRTNYFCSACNVGLCPKCFDSFHNTFSEADV